MSLISTTPPPPFANELTITFPRFAKSKGLLAMPFRVQALSFTLVVYTGVPAAAAAAVPAATTAELRDPFAIIKNNAVDGWVGCFLLSHNAETLTVRLRMSRGGRSSTFSTGLVGRRLPKGDQISFSRYVERGAAVTEAKEHCGGCLTLELAMDVILSNSDVRRDEREYTYLPEVTNRALRNDLLATLAEEHGGGSSIVESDFQVVVPAAAAAEDATTTTTEQVQVHKYVLAARSPVMRAMLASTMTEATNGRMEIVGHSAAAVQALVRFLYTDVCKVDVLAEHGWELLELADKYEVAGLHRVCEVWLGGCIRADTAIETLQRADMHNAPTLKRKALEYVRANKRLTLGGEDAQAALRDLGADLLSEVVCAMAD